MLDTIKLDGTVIEFVGTSLAGNETFLTAALKNNILSLLYLPDVSVSEFPHLFSLDRIVKYFEVDEEEKFLKLLQKKIPLGNWDDTSFVAAWLTAGGDLYHSWPNKYIDDKESILLHARHFFNGNIQPTHYAYPARLYARELCCDKDFSDNSCALLPQSRS